MARRSVHSHSVKHLRMHFTVSYIRRLFDCFLFFVIILISSTLIYRPKNIFPSVRRLLFSEARERYKRVTIELDIQTSQDGFSFPVQSQEEMFLSYQPPGGSWSKQLLAFENAVLMAKLLNRTLIAHPLSSEEESARLQRIHNRAEGHWTYNFMNSTHLLPVSAIIDFNRLRRFIRVREYSSIHEEFNKDFQHLLWYNVCHNENIGFWVDFIPSFSNAKGWKLLQSQQFSPMGFFNTEDQCNKLEVRRIQPSIRGILTELFQLKHRMIYFTKGTLNTRDIRFLSRERTIDAQRWMTEAIQFSSSLIQSVRYMVERIGQPYNALYVKQHENAGKYTNHPDFWLQQIEKRNFRNITKKLFIVTNQENDTWSSFFESHGYSVVSSTILNPHPSSGRASLQHDLVNLQKHLLCKYARLFQGPYYSFDTYFIERLRAFDLPKKDGLITSHLSVKWAGHTAKKGVKVTYAADEVMRVNMSVKNNFASSPVCQTCLFLTRRAGRNLCTGVLAKCTGRKTKGKK